ncbi:MAG: ABC transporter permease [Candidatus Methanomethylicia archaeon]
MGLITFIIKRLSLLPLIALGLAFISFFIGRVVVEDPTRIWIGEKATEEVAKALIERYHLKDPPYVAFFYYVINLASGDWGISPRSGQAILPMILSRFPATVELTLFATFLIIIIGIPFGILSALYKDKLIDHFSRFSSLSGISSPPFLIALLLQFILYYKLGFFPSGSRLDPTIPPPPNITGLFLIDSLITGNFKTFIASLRHIFLPSLALAILNVGWIVRMTRSTILEVLEKDYIKTAKMKGLKEREFLYKHVLRNALIPTTTVLAMNFATMLSGNIVIETIFGWPGIGRFAVESVLNLDYPAIIGVSIFYAIIFVLANFFADLLYAFLDPRIKVG